VRPALNSTKWPLFEAGVLRLFAKRIDIFKLKTKYEKK
jgi:hypothetical protein